MIIDTLSNHVLYTSVHPLFREAFHWLTTTDCSTLADGNHAIDDDNVFAILNTYKTKAEKSARAESHRKYIDIQCVLTGMERIGYLPLVGVKAATPYDQKKDFLLYDQRCSFIRMQPGMFAVFFPGDIHMPSISVHGASMVRKVVLKVRC